MKIYTKTGDKGTTSLVGGKRVSKSHARINAYGSMDELISYLGLLRDQGIREEIHDFILLIQDKLMICATLLAADCEDCKEKLPGLDESDINVLENEIDTLEKELSPLYTFVIPGGHSTISHTHVARSICRRVERLVIKLTETGEVNNLILKYLNRLSDYLFVLSRKFHKDFKINEIPWKPKV